MSKATTEADRGEGEAGHTIDGEPAYPIYYLSAKWIEEGGDDNSGGAYRMYREHPSEARLATDLRELIEGYRKRREIVRVTKLAVEFKHHETWCLTWFQHWTFDRGQTDREALRSFHNYVDRHAWYQEHDYNFDDHVKGRVRERIGHDPICLMGAEDRWRWHGSEDGSADYEKNTDPPCRCEHCQEQGKIRIGH